LTVSSVPYTHILAFASAINALPFASSGLSPRFCA